VMFCHHSIRKPESETSSSHDLLSAGQKEPK
jgi:hypothetical protein